MTTPRKDHEFSVRPRSEFSSAFRSFSSHKKSADDPYCSRASLTKSAVRKFISPVCGGEPTYGSPKTQKNPSSSIAMPLRNVHGELLNWAKIRHLSNVVNKFLGCRFTFSHKNPQLFQKMAAVTVRSSAASRAWPVPPDTCSRHKLLDLASIEIGCESI